MVGIIRYVLAACCGLLFPVVSFSQNSKLLITDNDSLLFDPPLIYPALTAKFYVLNGNRLIWTGTDEPSRQLSKQLKLSIDSSVYAGLDPARYHLQEINRLLALEKYPDSATARRADLLFTDAAVALCKHLYQGANGSGLAGYDEISKKYEAADNDFILQKLASITSADGLALFTASLEPFNRDYKLVRDELALLLRKNDALHATQLAVWLNLQRWVLHFGFDNCIVVNIPSATLRYYHFDTVALQMKVVVGKPATKTPRFAAYCNQVILYPYWNVPASIALNELLPKVKRNPAVLDAMNMQVVDGNGKPMAPSQLSWHRFNKGYFPYRFRQSTGCDNSLGVIKFNVTDPYSVYMHDTNNKTAFMSGYRFYSHGCIRLEQPVLLGNLLLGNKLDTAFLQSCYTQQTPVTIDIEKPVAVFVIYSTADTDAANRIKFYKDVYGLLK